MTDQFMLSEQMIQAKSDYNGDTVNADRNGSTYVSPLTWVRSYDAFGPEVQRDAQSLIENGFF